MHFTDVDSINLHVKCRAGYINRKNIESAIAKRVERASQRCRAEGEGPAERRLRSTAPMFKSEEDCLYCGKNVVKQFEEEKKRKVSSERRKNCIRPVETIQKKEDAIREAARKRGDAWADAVVTRLNGLLRDLVSAEAKYDNDCDILFSV